MAGNPFEREAEGIIIIGSNGQREARPGQIPPRAPVDVARPLGAAAPAGPTSHTDRPAGSASSAGYA